MNRAVWWISVTLLTVATLAAAGLGTWQLLAKSHLPMPADPAAARQAAMDAAGNGSVKILTYSPDTVDQDIAAAKALLTGEFLDYYEQFTSQVVAPGAKEKGVTTSAKLQRAGVEALAGNSATILVFLSQTTSSNEKPDATTTSSAVRVGLTKVHGTWLISRFDPV